MKPARVRPRVDREIDAIADYLASDSLNVARRFLDAMEKTLALIGEYPGIGSPRYAYLPALQGLRMSVVQGFDNYWVFYLERTDYIDVLRVLHGARDLPASLLDS